MLTIVWSTDSKAQVHTLVKHISIMHAQARRVCVCRVSYGETETNAGHVNSWTIVVKLRKCSVENTIFQDWSKLFCWVPINKLNYLTKLIIDHLIIRKFMYAKSIKNKKSLKDFNFYLEKRNALKLASRPTLPVVMLLD